jgi:hypothetical protein
MRSKVGSYLLLACRHPHQPAGSFRWVWFIAFSTILLVGIAAAIEVWFPAWAPLDRALALFALVQAMFLYVQKVWRCPDSCG